MAQNIFIVAAKRTAFGTFGGKIKIELLQNKIYSNKIDIWSLGITAVELFDGKPPWYPMNKNRVIELIKSVGLPPLPSNISPGFESYLKHSFTSNPENLNYDELMSRLETLEFMAQNINKQFKGKTTI
ncbi:18401_t:CDS:2 [Entrophospora sp. SA101]|nr:18401_t:CDS:2 [Entrophospora sp. SA101]